MSTERKKFNPALRLYQILKVPLDHKKDTLPTRTVLTEVFGSGERPDHYKGFSKILTLASEVQTCIELFDADIRADHEQSMVPVWRGLNHTHMESPWFMNHVLEQSDLSHLRLTGLAMQDLIPENEITQEELLVIRQELDALR